MLSDAFALAPPVASGLRFSRQAAKQQAAKRAAKSKTCDGAESRCPLIVDSQWIEPLPRKGLLKHEDSQFEHRTLGPRAAIRLWPRQHIVAVSFSVVH
jgi:hypothetical protein